MIGEEIFDGIEKPENWPANAKECELENIYISLKKFIKDPSYKNKEVLVALADNYDLNQESLLGLYRYSEYEVTMINFLFIHATAMNCNVLKAYLYEHVGLLGRLLIVVIRTPLSGRSIGCSPISDTNFASNSNNFNNSDREKAHIKFLFLHSK